MNYYKAKKFKNFIIIASNISNTELLQLKESNSKCIQGTELEPSIRSDGQQYFLSEWQEYTFLGTTEKPLTTDDFLQNGHLGINNTGFITFKNFIGMTRFREQLFEVDSEKVDSNQLQNLLSYIDQRIEETVSLNFSSQGIATGEYKKSPERFKKFYMYQHLYKMLTDKRIVPYLQIIQKYPNQQIETEILSVPLSRTKHISTETIADIMSGVSEILVAKSSLDNTQFRSFLPKNVNEYTRKTTVNTNGNQFIKFFIIYCVKLLTNFIRDLVADDANNLYTSNVLLIEELQAYRKYFQKLLINPFFKQVSAINHINFSSTILTKKYGYKDVYKLYLELKQVPMNVFGTKDLILLFKNKSIDKIYEYICLFRLVDILNSIYLNKSAEHIKTNTESKIYSVSLSENNDEVEFFFPESKIFPKSRLTFQHSFTKSNSTSYSVEFRPDFTLEIISDQNKKCYYHFDSKFRISNYGSSKNDDIVKMHSYRDGIVGTIGAFVLFPGDQKDIYLADSRHPYSGVGALPLKFDGSTDSKIKLLLLDSLKSFK
ncbi:DUF2357 domain-containing protein [Leuconostoc mesenteroides]|uniref:DUF2357 domain-containing protein n=1 Tax=Leuconostoc mesenteroides TaxID=1245 RepID=UPI001CC0B597|nr:DUF2357 domain-containing protein [Leuconostoc mesenteroides]